MCTSLLNSQPLGTASLICYIPTVLTPVSSPPDNLPMSGFSSRVTHWNHWKRFGTSPFTHRTSLCFHRSLGTGSGPQDYSCFLGDSPESRSTVLGKPMYGSYLTILQTDLLGSRSCEIGQQASTPQFCWFVGNGSEIID